MRYRWTVLAVGTAAQASFSAVLLGVAVLAPALQDLYHLDLSEVGVLLASVSLGMMLALLGWGLAADRVGERVIAAGGLSCAGLALAGAAAARSFALLVVLLAIAGIFGASVNAATGRAIMSWFGPSERGLALGIRQTSVPIGGACAALGLPALVSAAGARWALFALGAACLACAALAAAALREHPDPPAEIGFADLAHPLRDRRIWRLASGSALLLGANVGVLGFAVLFLHDARGFSPAEAGAVLAAMQVLGGALRIGSGRWSDRVGDRLGPLRRLAILIAASVGTTAALVDAPTWLLLPALIAAGGLSMGWNGLSFTAAAELAGRARSGAALGLQQTALAASGTLSALAFAPLVAATSWQAGFAVAALCPLAGLAVLRGV
ncbi:MAG: MFS transporter [Actinobacteria bacterium]|nr:MFS transporter [Actinomycetota bacterium]